MRRTLIPYFWPSITLYLPSQDRLRNTNQDIQKGSPRQNVSLPLLYPPVLIPLCQIISLGSRLCFFLMGKCLVPTEVPCRLHSGSGSREEACQKPISTGTQKHGLNPILTMAQNHIPVKGTGQAELVTFLSLLLLAGVPGWGGGGCVSNTGLCPFSRAPRWMHSPEGYQLFSSVFCATFCAQTT